MRHAKRFRVPRTSGAARLVAELVVDPRKGGTLDKRRTQTHASGSENGPVAPVYRLLVLDDSEQSTNEDALPGSASNESIPFDLDDIITVEEVSSALHVRREWIIRRWRKYPFIRRLSRKKYIGSRLILRRWLTNGPSVLGST
jgi:hypothetical protein